MTRGGGGRGRGARARGKRWRQMPLALSHARGSPPPHQNPLRHPRGRSLLLVRLLLHEHLPPSLSDTTKGLRHRQARQRSAFEKNILSISDYSPSSANFLPTRPREDVVKNQRQVYRRVLLTLFGRRMQAASLSVALLTSFSSVSSFGRLSVDDI